MWHCQQREKNSRETIKKTNLSYKHPTSGRYYSLKNLKLRKNYVNFSLTKTLPSFFSQQSPHSLCCFLYCIFVVKHKKYNQCSIPKGIEIGNVNTVKIHKYSTYFALDLKSALSFVP